MTAVEWLYEQIQKDQYSDALTPLEWIKVIEQAKEMEKQQIVDAHLIGLITSLETEATKQATEYYNNNFKQ